MASSTDIKQSIHSLLDQIDDPEALQLVEKLLKKLVNKEGNDLLLLQEMKQERKQLRNEKDKIYNILSYHLGSPLRTLQALSNMLLDDAHRLEKKGVMEFNEHLNSQIVRLQELMGNLIEWSGLMVKNYQVNATQVKVLPMIEEIVDRASKQIENKQLAISIEVEPTAEVYFDKRMLQIVFQNIISNALKFSPKEGQIDITAEERGDQLLVTIKDTGIGMSASKLKNIFNPSRKATQRGTANELGLGMGLIVAKAFLAENGSEIQVESERDKGTNVSFLLRREAIGDKT